LLQQEKKYCECTEQQLTINNQQRACELQSTINHSLKKNIANALSNNQQLTINNQQSTILIHHSKKPHFLSYYSSFLLALLCTED
jgi:hypothetical protein